jgi:RNA polymerase sigma-70 factor (ECF subfamily)
MTGAGGSDWRNGSLKLGLQQRPPIALTTPADDLLKSPPNIFPGPAANRWIAPRRGMPEQSRSVSWERRRRVMADPPPLIAAYMRKRADLVRFFTLRTGSAATAEDVVQDLFVKISEMETPADLRSPEAFLYRIGSNLMLDRAKAQRRQAARDHAWSREAAGDGPEPVAPEPPADDAVAGRQRLQRLLAAVETLPPKVASAFRLHKFEGLSHAEVAARLGVSRSAVEKYIMTALKTLMAEVER